MASRINDARDRVVSGIINADHIHRDLDSTTNFPVVNPATVLNFHQDALLFSPVGDNKYRDPKPTVMRSLNGLKRNATIRCIGKAAESHIHKHGSSSQTVVSVALDGVATDKWNGEKAIEAGQPITWRFPKDKEKTQVGRDAQQCRGQIRPILQKWEPDTVKWRDDTDPDLSIDTTQVSGTTLEDELDCVAQLNISATEDREQVLLQRQLYWIMQGLTNGKTVKDSWSAMQGVVSNLYNVCLTPKRQLIGHALNRAKYGARVDILLA
jgi:hypothetical protein